MTELARGAIADRPWGQTLSALGTRGLTGLKSLFLGSVSHAALEHADRPVMVVPSGEVAAARAADRAEQ